MSSQNDASANALANAHSAFNNAVSVYVASVDAIILDLQNKVAADFTAVEEPVSAPAVTETAPTIPPFSSTTTDTTSSTPQ